MRIEQIIELIYQYTPNILFGGAIFIFFWFFSKVVQYGVKNLLKATNPETNVSNVIASIIKNFIVIIGLITALGTVGINVSAIVAGLGLTGFAFGFAFKDMLSNYISGILLFIYEPFKLGDKIEVEGKTGKVVDINLRYVTIESEDKKVLIPNSISVSKVIAVIR